MNIKVTIEKETVHSKKGTSAKTGKPYEIREQECIVQGIGRFPVQTRLTLPDNVEGYKAGDYEVTTPLTIGRFGLEVSRDLGLVPVRAANAKAAA